MEPRYQLIKSLILIIPTLSIALWEFCRHTFLLPYISMEIGNYLAPVIIFMVTITVVKPLFKMMEATQEQLSKERTSKAALMEREQIANELHDGMAQSLFLLSINVQQMEKKKHDLKEENFSIMNQTVQKINAYVRKAISNLRYPPAQDVLPWREVMEDLATEFKNDTGIMLLVDWKLSDERLTLKEKIELKSNLREALLNIRKHANANQAWIYTENSNEEWQCSVVDDGQGFQDDPLKKVNCFGLKIMKERSEKMGWNMQIVRDKSLTKIIFGKREFG